MYKTRYELARHEKLHREHNSFYSCTQETCLRTQTSAAAIAAHMEKHKGPAEKKMVCNFQNCAFAGTKEKLTSHMRAKHTGEALFGCRFCARRFFTGSAANEHEKKHSDNSKKQCDQCLKFYDATVVHVHK